MPLLQLAVSVESPEHEPIPLQGLDLVFVPLPQFVLHDPYGSQWPQDAVKSKVLICFCFCFCFCFFFFQQTD